MALKTNSSWRSASHSDLAANFRGCAERAHSAVDRLEWERRLTVPQKTIVEGIATLISQGDAEAAFTIFQRLRVDIIRDADLERDFAPPRMPNTSVAKEQLLTALRDLAGGEARVRGIFRAPNLRQQLLDLYSIQVEEPTDWGLPAYLRAVESMSTIRVPGTSFGGPPDRIFIWPRATHTDHASDFEDEQIHRRLETRSDIASLEAFPSNHLSQCIVYAGPGFGKSALLQAIAHRLVRGTHIPALIPLPALADADVEVVDYLNTILNAELKVAINWPRLCDQGLAVVLIDGLDEVPTPQRQSIIKRLDRFNARFPACPWLLTVRDLAVVPAGFEAQTLEILPLSREEIAAFVDRWGTLGIDAGWDFVERVEAYPDLAHLIRIPLFLAILLATWNPNEPLPTGRSELIEVYLKTLFRPEEFKVTPRAADPEQLRVIAEDLAFQLLEQGTIGAGERSVRSMIAQYATGSISADTLFDDLLRCGVLRHQTGTRIGFPFPIVQEYLAACRLVSRYRHEVASRAERAAERPWAQVIQFALEMLPDASEIVRALLARKDDAFATTLRLVGRCIVNRMSCDPDLQLEVGRRLAAAWSYASHTSAKRIGQLLADGWMVPLLPELREAATQPWLVHAGGGEILSRLGDDDLTDVALSRYVKRLTHLWVLGPFQPAVSKLADRALQLYAGVARTRELNDDEIHALASLISKLDGKRISSDLASSLRDDTHLAASIRIAAAEILGDEPTPEISSLIDEALRTVDWRVRRPAFCALRCASDVEDRIVGYLRSESVTAETKRDLLDHLYDPLPDADRRRHFAATQAENPDLDGQIRGFLLVIAASLGDEAAMRKLVAGFNSLSVEVVSPALMIFGHFRLRELGAEAVAKLRDRPIVGSEIAQLVGGLVIAATLIADMRAIGSATVRSAPPHPASDLFIALVDEWRVLDQFDPVQRLSVETAASRAGLEGASDSLKASLTKVIGEHDIGGFENPLNNSVRGAIDELREKRQLLDLPILIHLVESSSANAWIGAIYMIGAHGTRAALDYLLEMYNRGGEDRHLVFEWIEHRSSRLSITIVRNGDILRVEERQATGTR